MCVGEDNPSRSQSIHVGSDGLGITLQHAIPVIEVINRNKQNVGLTVLAPRSACFISRADYTSRKDRQEKQCLFTCLHVPHSLVVIGFRQTPNHSGSALLQFAEGEGPGMREPSESAAMKCSSGYSRYTPLSFVDL